MLNNNNDICKAIELLEEALKNDIFGIVSTNKLSDMNFKQIKKLVNIKQSSQKISSDRFITKYLQKENRVASDSKLFSTSDSKIFSDKPPVKSEESLMSIKKVSSKDIKDIINSHVL
jgi:hypothetical protein